MSNIKNNNFRKIDCRLINDYYMDFMLSKDDSKNVSNTLENQMFAAILNFDKQQKKHVISDVGWNNAILSNTVLKNIGYTGVDNGFISYDRDMIGNDEFLELYTKTTFDLSKYEDKFFVTEVTGNTHMLNYPIEINDEYTSLKGGFYQGFFKIDGDAYQTLPNIIDDEWNFIFNLRRRDYQTELNILNNLHPDNKGMFFYIGTRAENKFWELYNDEYDYTNINDEQYNEDEYFEETLTDDYLIEQISLNDISLKDSNGLLLNENNDYYEIETNNKFIIFNNTKNGFNIKNWNDDYKFILTGKTSSNVNYFQYLNSSKNGYNKNNISQLQQDLKKDYDVFKDLKQNALGFKINDDGSLTYRYFSKCEIIEETSKPNIIKKDEWTNINIKLSCKKNTINNNYGQGKMLIFIYVDGYLKFISKELPELMLKSLDDDSSKQEGVPYNISIGGGSQGLCERIFLNYYDVSKNLLPIEKYFGGSFIGDIKNFMFIPNKIDFEHFYKYLYNKQK